MRRRLVVSSAPTPDLNACKIMDFGGCFFDVNKPITSNKTYANLEYMELMAKICHVSSVL